jgi:D-sedoheptulose 7-phosphate isomerase
LNTSDHLLVGIVSCSAAFNSQSLSLIESPHSGEVMSDDELIRSALEASAQTKRDMITACSETLKTVAAGIADAMRNRQYLLLCGNGGSAADCQHIAAEFVVRLTSRNNRDALPALALTTDTSTLTAAANDFGFNRVFARQIEALGRPGDVLIAISTSGRSPNLLEAARAARSRGMKVIAFLGAQKRELGDLADIALCIPSEDSQRVQEGHITAGHILVALVERSLMVLGHDLH